MWNPLVEEGHGLDRSSKALIRPELLDNFLLDFFFGKTDKGAFYDHDIPFEEKKAMSDKQVEAFVEHSKAVLEGTDSVDVAEVFIPASDVDPNAPDLEALVHSPSKKSRKKRPGVLYCAGGALLYAVNRAGTPCNLICDEIGAVCVAPAYRASFDAPYPAAVNDLHNTYKWMVDNADELGIDPDNITIVGQSSGAHLGAALAFRLKRNGFHPRGCVIIDFVMDDRGFYPSQRLTSTGWPGIASTSSAALYLGAQAGNPNLGPEAFPNRADVADCVGVCPFFIHTNEIDPEVDPAMHFSSKLRQAGTFCELHQWGGVPHGLLYSARGTSVGDLFYQTFLSNIRDCTKYDLRRLDVE